MTAVATPRRRIAQVAPFFPPHLGGVERVAEQIAEHLAVRHDVEVVTTTCGASGAPRSELVNRVYIRRFRGVTIAHTPLSPGLVLRLLRLPRHAVVHAHVAQAFLPEMIWLTSVLRRRPYVLHFHLDVDPSGPFGVLLAGYKRRVLGPVLRRAAAVIALTPEQAAEVSARYAVPADRVHVVANGVSEEFAALADRERVTSRGDGPLRVLFVGRIDAQKNLVRLVQALAVVTHPVELTVVGDGEERLRVREAAAAAGLTNVRLVGAAHGDDLLGWYRWAEAFVLPSDREGMPLVVLEAMAAGLPVLVTDVPGSRELVEGVGLVVPPTATGLAAGIDRLASDPTLRADLADRSRRRGAEHVWSARVEEIEAVYARSGVT